ncbi:unnamed protein product [Bursaphelenchus okinawaensis]|uniref:G-protein coupled receptors family 1 profile domain-containing protein n=1 Tax=Bursaphelenchus okinawaensis TaxID=465554 RepID=A0A811KJ76_9BILA|nr:unnamed protein product [Bursaphelenchus okinawaensis]CAG9104835.1 unnamed protein product [Bursaphelenchus okinawaensis]
MDYLMDVLFGEHSSALDVVMFMSVEDIDRRCPRGLNSSMLNDTSWKLAPFDDVCLNTFFQRMNAHLRKYNEWEEMLYTFLYFLISFFALVGNGVVILAVIRKKEMRTNRNVLIVNLALSNLMLALTTIPFLWLPSIDFEFPYSKFFCKFANALPGSNIYCSTLTISVMAIDRYYSVKQMTVGSVNQSCLKGIILSIMIWVFSFLLSFPLLIYYDTTMLYVFKDVMVYDSEKNTTQLRSYGWRQCRLSPGGATAEDDQLSTMNADAQARMIQLVMSLMQVLFLYVVPLIVLSIFNVKLTRFLKTNAKHMSKNRNGIIRRESVMLQCNKTQQTHYTVNWSPKKKARNPSLLETELSSTTSPGSRMDSATPAERASDRRRNRTTMLLIAMAGSYAVLWFPFTLVSMLIDMDILYLENGAAIIERIDQSCKLISILSIGVNPFLYGFLNTNFRHEFTDIFNSIIRCSATQSAQRNRSTMYSAIQPNLNQRSHSFLETIQSACGSVFSLKARLDQPRTPPEVSKSSSSEACALQVFPPEKEHQLLAVPTGN